MVNDTDDELVSVIVCTYNQGSTITRAIDSALAQDHRPIEVLVVDNGSTDSTPAALAAYVDVPELRVIRHGVNGPVTNRLNRAIGEARGAYISILYGDDAYLPGKLHSQVEAFRSLDISYGVVYTPGRVHNDITGEEWESDSLRASGWIFMELLDASQRGYFINPISPLVRRECLIEHPFYEDLFVEGEAQYLRIAITHRFQFLPKITVIMHAHKTNIGKAIRINGEGMVLVMRRLAVRTDLPPGSQERILMTIGVLHRNLGWQGVRVIEDPAWARRQFAAAVHARRLEALRPKTIAGIMLSMLPGGALSAINRFSYRVRPPREVVGSRDGYT